MGLTRPTLCWVQWYCLCTIFSCAFWPWLSVGGVDFCAPLEWGLPVWLALSDGIVFRGFCVLEWCSLESCASAFYFEEVVSQQCWSYLELPAANPTWTITNPNPEREISSCCYKPLSWDHLWCRVAVVGVNSVNPYSLLVLKSMIGSTVLWDFSLSRFCGPDPGHTTQKLCALGTYTQ